jgi:GntP family gluconate:H+ symporter
MTAALPDVNRELMVVAIGAGSLVAGHVNDGGFWLVKEYFGLDVGQTIKTWSACVRRRIKSRGTRSPRRA